MLRLRWIGSISLPCIVLAASSCGSGDPLYPDPVPAAVTLSGTVAAGLPLAGTVTVKDSAGRIRDKPIDANGSYSIDVSGMTAPLVLRAEGDAGGTYYEIHSATAVIGTGGTLNVTPLTDLIVSNAAGTIAGEYFFGGGNFSGLTATALAAESAALKYKLQPVLDAVVGPAAAGGIDLLHTPFTPLAPGFDTALELIRVSVDPATRVATITNAADPSATITDDITRPASSEGSSPPQLGAGATTTQVAGDLPKIRQALTDFIDLFKTDLPPPAAILPALSEYFLHKDQNRAAFANGRAGRLIYYAHAADDASALVGASFTDIIVHVGTFNYDYARGPLVNASFTVRDRNGILLRRMLFVLIRGNDGVWRLYGDQSALHLSFNALALNDLHAGCRFSGLLFEISDEDVSNSANINRVVVTGPGLPARAGLPQGTGSLRFDRDDRYWNIRNDNGDYDDAFHVMTGTAGGGCGDYARLSDDSIAAMPDNAIYSVQAYDSANVRIPLGIGGMLLLSVPRPLTLAQLTAATQFPMVAASPALADYSGGNITVNVANANPARRAVVSLEMEVDEDLDFSTDALAIPASDGTFSRTLSLNNLPAGVITGRTLVVASQDANDRLFATLEEWELVQGTWKDTLKARDLDGNPATIEAYYDTALNITWLADANYALTSGYTTFRLTWETANTWAAGLNIGGVTGWRLPTTVDVGNDGFTTGGNIYQGVDAGFNITAHSEMSHLFYVTLGNLAQYDTSGNPRPAGTWGLTNSGPFRNIEVVDELEYWSATENVADPIRAWIFRFSNGSQTNHIKDGDGPAWAVHSGDVGVPVGG